LRSRGFVTQLFAIAFYIVLMVLDGWNVEDQLKQKVANPPQVVLRFWLRRSRELAELFRG